MTTDGACIGNPGPGGWACVLRYFDRKKEIFGSEENTTNNRTELRAVIEGLKMLREPCEVVMVTDSQYVRQESEDEDGSPSQEENKNEDQQRSS